MTFSYIKSKQQFTLEGYLVWFPVLAAWFPCWKRAKNHNKSLCSRFMKLQFFTIFEVTILYAILKMQLNFSCIAKQKILIRPSFKANIDTYLSLLYRSNSRKNHVSLQHNSSRIGFGKKIYCLLFQYGEIFHARNQFIRTRCLNWARKAISSNV